MLSPLRKGSLKMLTGRTIERTEGVKERGEGEGTKIRVVR